MPRIFECISAERPDEGKQLELEVSACDEHTYVPSYRIAPKCADTRKFVSSECKCAVP